MKKILNILMALTLLFFITNIGSAQVLDPSAVNNLKANTDLVGSSGGLGQASVGSIVATIIQAGLGLLAAIFLILMILAGFRWMTAGGNEAQVKKAQETITTAIIGLVIVLAAYAITYFIFKYLPFTSGSVGGGGNGGVGGS